VTHRYAEHVVSAARTFQLSGCCAGQCFSGSLRGPSWQHLSGSTVAPTLKRRPDLCVTSHVSVTCCPTLTLLTSTPCALAQDGALEWHSQSQQQLLAFTRYCPSLTPSAGHHTDLTRPTNVYIVLTYLQAPHLFLVALVTYDKSNLHPSFSLRRMSMELVR
jgi:hypothetical protein